MTLEEFRSKLLFDFEKETNKLTYKIVNKVISINNALQPYYTVLYQTRHDLNPTFQFIKNGFNGFMGYLNYKDGELYIADIGGVFIKFKNNEPVKIKFSGERKSSELYDYVKELAEKLDKVTEEEFVQNCLERFE